MSDPVEALRAMQQAKIQENPVQITITRTAKVRQGGGFAEGEPEAVGPLTVRVYQSNTRRNPQVGSLAGTQERQGWGLMADHTADLKDGPLITDLFEVADIGRFTIKQVRPLKTLGAVYGYQAELEKVT